MKVIYVIAAILLWGIIFIPASILLADALGPWSWAIVWPASAVYGFLAYQFFPDNR